MWCVWCVAAGMREMLSCRLLMRLFVNGCLHENIISFNVNNLNGKKMGFQQGEEAFCFAETGDGRRTAGQRG